MKIGLLLIATNKYDVFLQPLLDSIDKYFFVNNNIEIYLFTDKKPVLKHSKRINVVRVPIEHKPFPLATLYRYKYFNTHRHLFKTDYLFYSDVDMLFVDSVGKEILPTGPFGLVATEHTGFVGDGWGSNNVEHNSTAYLEPELRKRYFAGGFQGGTTNAYLLACKVLDRNIDKDEESGIIAEWHDESHWNFLLKTYPYLFHHKILSHEYCMSDTKLSGSPKILALTKDHDAIRF